MSLVHLPVPMVVSTAPTKVTSHWMFSLLVSTMAFVTAVMEVTNGIVTLCVQTLAKKWEKKHWWSKNVSKSCTKRAI